MTGSSGTALAAGWALALAAACGTPSFAGPDPALYPAAQCAAFWFGWDDYARRSTLLDRTPGDLARASAFRRAAYRLAAGRTDGIDTFIAGQRGLMMRMIDEALYAPGESRSLMERLMQTCDDFAATQPETSDLP